MEDWIAGTFAVLGTLMILAGGTLIVLRTLGRVGGVTADPDTVPLGGTAGSPPADPAAGRRFSLRRLSPATQLIGWGVVLLVVAALAVDLINFDISVGAGTEQPRP
jgi:hypothetical protein